MSFPQRMPSAEVHEEIYYFLGIYHMGKYLTLKLHGALLELPSSAPQFEHSFITAVSIKDVMESHDIPHTEVGKIESGGEKIPFSEIVKPGSTYFLFPYLFSDLIHSGETFTTKFILDVQLGKLARWMRMLGFDTDYDKDITGMELISRAIGQTRFILTRDMDLLKRKIVNTGYWVRSTDPDEQIKEIINRFKITNQIHPLTRCLNCNCIIKPIARDKISEQLLPKTKEHFNEFYYCTGCDNIYWKGSHYQNMLKMVSDLESGFHGK